MRPVQFLAAALALAPGLVAASKSAIVWFDNPNTPDDVINRAKDDIVKAGGKITHVYTIIKGFSVVAPETALQGVQAWGTEHSVRIEEDNTVSVNV
ncbi:unnamed protein product [Clonostachys rosea]|uniref:Inhibitor I9 domain-containing protein n=4 Tax=Clonostachys TaxID=110564 RepID=A0ABY6TMK8_BIOOC|nr:unnamed protein product [Clonostachys byssicola]CAH0020448.1 unnamed protein product [Clonostachys rhizophaga]CAH0041586.1 unnamed protein product [Clonostachys solani]VUC19810.1 unnamed protein product [Clonostachys rosea]